MKDQRHFSKRTRSRGALDTVRGPAGTRDRVIGQYRQQGKTYWESPDMKDRRPRRSVPLPPTPRLRHRPGLGNILVCAGCGRTQDLWQANNGEGLSKAGKRFCCKPCSQGDACICGELEDQNGQELDGLQRIANRRRR